MAATRSSRTASRGVPVGRVAAVVVLMVIAALYVGPVERYLAVQRQLNQQRGLVHRLQQQQAALETHARLLGTRGAVIQCARSRGWVLPGEHTLVVTGLPAAASNAC